MAATGFGLSRPEQTTRREAGPPIQLRLLDGFALVADGRTLAAPPGLQRLLAYLAIRHRPQQRAHVAGVLWTDEPEHRALANLRTAVWRLKDGGLRLLEVTPAHLAISEHVEIDLRRSSELAQRIVDGELPDTPATEELLAHELLPDWYDDWILLAREQHRQLRLHALEALSASLLAAGRLGAAIQTGLAAIAAEPLRESAHRRVIEAHLAEGNRCEARRQFELYRHLVLSTLGEEPSGSLAALVERPPAQLAPAAPVSEGESAEPATPPRPAGR